MSVTDSVLEPAATPSLSPPPDELARIQELLASGDVSGAELALKQLKKQLRRSNVEKKTIPSKMCDVVAVAEGDEHKQRRVLEKEQKRARDEIEKAVKDSIKNSLESEGRRSKEEKRVRDRLERERKDEKKDRERTEKERREIDRQENDARKDLTRHEKHVRDEMERQRKHMEKTMKKEKDRPQPALGKQPPVQSLLSFGFSAEKRAKGTSENHGLLFSQFVPSTHQLKRLVPPRLAFWQDETVRQLSLSEPAPTSNQMETSCAVPDGFCKEVVFCGFSAIGFEPAQARPSYWGTMNPTLNENELLALARFPLHSAMPRLSTLNYDYDSGDDWDVMDSDDDDVEASDDEEGESESSASNDSFIDDGACSDSDNEHVSSFINARTRRLNRLRGKDRLVPMFSGPFESLPTDSHPLSSKSAFHVAGGFNAQLVEDVLLSELAKTVANDIVAKPKMQIQRYRQIEHYELQELQEFVSENARLTQSGIVDTLSKRPSFAGIATMEIRRVLKRFFEQNCGMFVARSSPWAADDERLFEKKLKKTKPTQDCEGTLGEHSKRERAAVNE